jgi:hypothetical protein
MLTRPGPLRRGAIVGWIAVAVLVGIAFWPTRIHVGIDYQVTEQQLPLWLKTWQFLQRDSRTQRLADSITAGIQDPGRRAQQVLQWTRQNIRPHPEGAPVIDDHVWSIVERGYGSNDQRADVFTTLLTYAGVRSHWTLVGPPPPSLPISLVLLEGRWRVVDVDQGIIFRNQSGEWASAEELAESPELIRASVTGQVPDPTAYLRYFEEFEPPRTPPVLRAELQMPGRRLAFELTQLVRRGTR